MGDEITNPVTMGRCWVVACAYDEILEGIMHYNDRLNELVKY